MPITHSFLYLLTHWTVVRVLHSVVWINITGFITQTPFAVTGKLPVIEKININCTVLGKNLALSSAEY